MFTVPSQGRGGGLALLWKSEVTVWVDSFSKFHIDAVVNGMTVEAWRFTGFYGKPNTNYREEAWSMTDVAVQTALAIVLYGRL